jgi:imidazoleglycerol-phosphate dehydratase
LVRMAEIFRTTAETSINLKLEIDGQGEFKGSSGIGFFDHMLNLLSRHSGFNISLEANGDLEVDGHHTVEDIGIVLGQALGKALGDKAGINRYGHIILPMDEALVMLVVDMSGRPFLSYDVPLPSSKVGNFDTELTEEFVRALATNAGLTLHIKLLAGQNTHHIIEAVFKGLGRVLRAATALDKYCRGIPSTKGIL